MNHAGDETDRKRQNDARDPDVQCGLAFAPNEREIDLHSRHEQKQDDGQRGDAVEHDRNRAFARKQRRRHLRHNGP